MNAEWEPINISLMDIQDSSLNATSNTWTWLTNNGYNSKAFAGLAPVDLTNFFSQMNNVQGLGGGLVTLKLLHLDDNGKEFESWEFLDPRLLEIQFGDNANYEDDGLLTVDIRFNIAAADYKEEGSNSTGEAPPIATPDSPTPASNSSTNNFTPPTPTMSMRRDI